MAGEFEPSGADARIAAFQSRVVSGACRWPENGEPRWPRLLEQRGVGTTGWAEWVPRNYLRAATATSKVFLQTLGTDYPAPVRLRTKLMLDETVDTKKKG